MYSTILLAINGSINSLRAANEAAKIASFQENSEITVVNVIDYSQSIQDVLHA